jgi:AcrR family transcriptional regulator
MKGLSSQPPLPESRARRGRPLDASRDAAIMQAALDGVAELGYDRLTMDEIAARAHAGKGALYRRWPSKATLVVDALVAWREQFVPVSIPDTGSLRGDMEAMIAAAPAFDETVQRQMGVFAGLATAAARDPELKAELSSTVLGRPRRLLRGVLDRAVARGEIPAERDLEIVADILIGLNILQVLLGEAPNRDYVERVFRNVIYPLVAIPPGSESPKTRSGK